MDLNYVFCPPETKNFLTVETREGGVVRSVLANLDGSPVQDNGIKYAGDHPDHVAVYIDLISGTHVVKVTAAQAAALAEDGATLLHSCGGVHGVFVEAPDFTIMGYHGEKAKHRAKRTEDPDEYGGPRPKTEEEEEEEEPARGKGKGRGKR